MVAQVTRRGNAIERVYLTQTDLEAIAHAAVTLVHDASGGYSPIAGHPSGIAVAFAISQRCSAHRADRSGQRPTGIGKVRR